jgi:hypothetical protein
MLIIKFYSKFKLIKMRVYSWQKVHYDSRFTDNIGTEKLFESLKDLVEYYNESHWDIDDCSLELLYDNVTDEEYERITFNDIYQMLKEHKYSKDEIAKQLHFNPLSIEDILELDLESKPSGYVHYINKLDDHCVYNAIICYDIIESKK